MHNSPRLPARRLLLLTTAALALPAAAATTGSGRSAADSRTVPPFAAIALRGDIDLVVRQAAQEAVQASADDNLLPLLQTQVEDRDGRPTLVVQWAPGSSVRPRARAVVTVDVVRLLALATAGSGDVSVGRLETPEFSLSLAGSSDVRLEQVQTGALKVAIAGSGDVVAAGRAASFDLSIAGSGDVRAKDLVAEAVSVSIAGSGDAGVHATRTLAVGIAGSGDVEYTGAAQVTRSHVAGSGALRRAP